MTFAAAVLAPQTRPVTDAIADLEALVGRAASYTTSSAVG
jgi:hypothetical protein